MNKPDSSRFDTELTAVLLVYGVGEPTDAVKRLWWMDLEPYPLEVVLDALTQHRRYSKFPPKPADIIESINSQDGRPNVEEAWTIALASMDESDSVVWTEEISRARSVARPLMEIGDRIGARMAFKEAYGKQMAMARDKMQPVQWMISIGFDPEKRTAALEHAIHHGRISHDQAERYLPAPEPTAEGKAIAGLLTGKAVELPEVHEREKLQRNFADVKSAMEDGFSRRKARKHARHLSAQIKYLNFEQERDRQLALVQKSIDQQTEVQHG